MVRLEWVDWEKGGVTKLLHHNIHPAMIIETEQLLEVDGFITSYLQVRGSIPVLWEQIVDLTYKPKLNIINTDERQKL